jgi:hypothetical protein
MPIKVNTKTKKHGDRYTFTTATLQLPRHECDVDLVLPNGQVISLQYRLEGPSLDVVLPEDTYVTNWQGDDMDPAFPAKEFPDGHVRIAKQLVIDIDPEWVEEIENTPCTKCGATDIPLHTNGVCGECLE